VPQKEWNSMQFLLSDLLKAAKRPPLCKSGAWKLLQILLFLRRRQGIFPGMRD
jgi:hypothetical protein